MAELILLLISFFLGAVPFGYLVAKKKKNIDIRNYGSGNIGATNVFRVVGKSWGILVFSLDFLKGFLVPFSVFVLYGLEVEAYFFIVLGAAAVLGHNWTPFLKFKGGKGVATSLGVLTALSFPFLVLGWILPLTLLVWLAVFKFSKMVSLASLLAGFVFFLLVFFSAELVELKIFAFLLFLFILFRHKKNIKMIFKGKENRF